MGLDAVSSNALDNLPAHTRPTGPPGWVLFVAAAIGLLLVAAVIAAWLGMWFTGGDAAWLAWAARASTPMQAGPPGSAVGWTQGPAVAVAWWAAFRAFGWTYGLYQMCHVVMWFAVLIAYGVMLRQLWGRRRRPALAATVMVAVTLVGFSEQILHLTHLPLTSELLFGLVSVAMAAAGWRHRRGWLVLLSYLPLAAACAGSIPASAYLACLHLAAALRGWRRPSLRPWVIAGGLGSTAVALICVWWTWPPTPMWSVADALGRWLAFRESIMSGPTALLLASLAAIAGLVQGMRQQMRRWPMIAAMGAILALTSLTLHPLLVVVALTLMTPSAWPFAVWAVVQQIVVLLDGAPWPAMPMAAMFAYVPVFVISIWRSPVAVWTGRFARRLDPTGRKLIYSVAALAAVLVVAHSGQWLERHNHLLRTLGQRRQLHRELLYQVAVTVPAGGAVSIVSYADMGTTAAAAEQLPPLSRARTLLSFTPAQYADLLAARGRDDLHVVAPVELPTTGGWLLITGRGERKAATDILGPLGTPQMTLTKDGIFGGLWRVPIAHKPPPPVTMPATAPATTPPAAEPGRDAD